MIESIGVQHLQVRCVVCQGIREVPLDVLVVKLVDATTAIVQMPVCSCGSVEILVRAERPEHPMPGSESHRHELLVDHLHAVLAAESRLAAGSAAAKVDFRPLPANVVARCFPHGLRLREPDAETPP